MRRFLRSLRIMASDVKPRITPPRINRHDLWAFGIAIIFLAALVGITGLIVAIAKFLDAVFGLPDGTGGSIVLGLLAFGVPFALWFSDAWMRAGIANREADQ